MRVALPLAPRRTNTVRSMPSGSERRIVRYVHRRVAVNDALPLGPERTGRTATRPWAHQNGTPDAEWQCGMRRPVRSPPSGSEQRVARYARCRVAVWDAPPGTFTAEWQCEMHCHSPLIVPDALPLAPGRTNTVRSMPSGSGVYTATRT